MAAEEAAAAEAGSEPEIDPHEQAQDDASGSDDDDALIQPAPLTPMSPRPRPTRANRPAMPRPKSKETEMIHASSPTTPTASSHNHSHRMVGGLHSDTQAWRDSVLTAQDEERNWRESSLTSTTASVEQHPYAPLPKARGQESNHGSPKPSLIPRLKKVGSNASVGALLPTSPTPPVSANTVSTMHSDSMSSGVHYISNSRFRPESRGGITTDGDSDADFQSAYSTSPRLTPGGTSDVERAGSGYGSGYGSGGRRRSRQGLPPPEKHGQVHGLVRVPSLTSTTISTGAVGGLGLVGPDFDSRSRASSIGTNLEASSATGKSTSGSDHTIGFPDTQSTATLSHPPVSLVNRVASSASLRARQDGILVNGVD